MLFSENDYNFMFAALSEAEKALENNENREATVLLLRSISGHPL